MHNHVLDYPTFQGKIEKYELKSIKLDVFYNKSDSRCWTAVISGTDNENIFVTYHINRYDIGDSSFDILASGKFIKEVEIEDIYQTIDLLIKNKENE